MRSKLRMISVGASIGLVLSAVDACEDKTGRTPRTDCVSVTVSARDTTHITIACKDAEGGLIMEHQERHPSDLYPKCQVGEPWPGCKDK
jgi:hypothetical protein